MDTDKINADHDRQRLIYQAIFIGIVAAILWWVIALFLFQQSSVVRVWHDQLRVFRVVPLDNPYSWSRFVNPVWVVPLVYPFRWLTLELSTLIQAIIYFVALALVIIKYGGDRRAIIITLFSYTSLDAVLQMNVDWMVIMGMLLPVWASGPFVFIKPQIGLGYYLGMTPRDWRRAAILILLVGLVSLLIWGWWLEPMLINIRDFILGQPYNIAPMEYLGIVSILIGILLGIMAFRRKDVPMGVLAGLFFTPYIAAYSLPLMLGMLAIRWQRLALIFTLSYWLVIAITVIPFLLQTL